MSEFKWQGDNDGGSGGGGGGSPYFIDPVPTASSLPGSAPEGTLVLVIDEDALYERRGGVWVLFVDPGEIQDKQDEQDSRLDGIDSDLTTLFFDKQDRDEKGQPNGYASLDGAGKVPVSQLPNSIMEYKGTYNALTNTPILIDGTGNTGDVYRVNVSGTQNFGSGSISFEVGDYVIYNGATWEKADATDAVTSVNGLQGPVVLTTTNIAEGTNQYFTTERAQDAVFTAIPSSATISSVYDDAGNQLFLDVIQSGININNTTGTLSIVKGGTSATTAAQGYNNLSEGVAGTPTKGDSFFRNTAGMARLPVGTDGYAIVADSTQALGVKYGPVVTNPMTTLGDSIVGGTAGLPTRLAGNVTTTRQFLRQVGNGTIANAQVWDTIQGTDVPQATATARGSVQGGTLPGSNGAAAIGSGFVGQIISKSITSATTYAGASGLFYNATFDDATVLITLTPGVWILSAHLYYSSGTGVTSVGCGISTDSSTTGFGDAQFGINRAVATQPSGVASSSTTVPMNYALISTSTNFYLKTSATFTTAPQYRGMLLAVRIG